MKFVPDKYDEEKYSIGIFYFFILNFYQSMALQSITKLLFGGLD